MKPTVPIGVFIRIVKVDIPFTVWSLIVHKHSHTTSTIYNEGTYMHLFGYHTALQLAQY